MQIVDLAKIETAIPQLAKWHHKEWSHLNPGCSVEDRIDNMQSYLDESTIPRTFVCKEEKTILGSAAIVDNDMESRKELSPWLASVYVDERFRNQGLGTALVKHVMEYAAGIGVKELYLFTESQTEFYEGLGWKSISKELYRNQDVTVMQVTLS